MKREDICHEMALEFLRVLPIPLTFDEFPPSLKHILNRNNIFIRMSEADGGHIKEATPVILPVLQKLKTAYLLWFFYYPSIPKTHRYTLAQRIDGILIETIEAVAAAGFLSRQEKLPYVRLAIRKMDTVKILFAVLWESKSLETKRDAAVSHPLEEVGRMLGGWHGQIVKQNSPGFHPRNS